MRPFTEELNHALCIVHVVGVLPKNLEFKFGSVMHSANRPPNFSQTKSRGVGEGNYRFKKVLIAPQNK